MHNFWRFLPLKQHFSSARSAPNCDELQTLKGGSSLSVTGIEHANESPPQARNRFDKARIFQVSGQISHALKTSAPTGKYSVVSVTLHDQGARIALPMDRQGKPSGFALKLEQQSESTKHPGTLHLSLINEQTGALEAEAWSDHNADTIGLNLKWIRINATAVAASH